MHSAYAGKKEKEAVRSNSHTSSLVITSTESGREAFGAVLILASYV